MPVKNVKLRPALRGEFICRRSRVCQANVRLVSSADETNVATSTGAMDVSGTTMEAPSLSAPGGGLGASIDLNVVKLSTPLLPGQTRAYSFKVDIHKGGSYFVSLNIEALPNS